MAQGKRIPRPLRNDEVVVGMFFRFYKLVVSPVLHVLSPTQCKFLPTCSEYGYVAFHRHGTLRGSWLTLRRVLRCHPFSPGGFDPVPPA